MADSHSIRVRLHLQEITHCEMPTDPRFTDLTGSSFGSATVQSFAGRSGRKLIWMVMCSCGELFLASTCNLKSGATGKCQGCVRQSKRTACLKIKRVGREKTHELNSSLEHGIWTTMLARCRNENAVAYEQYGGRGVKVCDRWLSFANFIADMGQRPSPEHSIDRFPDNNGNYEPGNCRWATRKQQARNTRSNRMITAFGKTQCLAAWAEETAIPYHTLKSRIVRLNWNPETALTKELRKCQKN